MAKKTGGRGDDYTKARARITGGKPLVTTSGAARQMEVAFTTAQRAIERLERSGIVQQTSDASRNRVYCARALPNILEEPAQLKLPNERRDLIP